MTDPPKLISVCRTTEINFQDLIAERTVIQLGDAAFANISYKNAAVLGKGHGENPFSARKGFSPCNCPTQIDFRVPNRYTIENGGGVWYNGGKIAGTL